MTTDTPSLRVGYAQEEPAKAAPWHGLVVWDMLFNGLSTGLFLVAALGELAAPEMFGPLVKAAYPVALVFLVVDLVLLVLDLGDPWRFHHMLRLFKPESPMSVGVWSMTVFSLPLTVAAVLSLFPTGGILEWVRIAAAVLGLVPAVVVAAYKGVLLSTSAQPGWKEARWLGGYLTTGAVVLGCAEMIVLAYLMDQLRAAQVLRPALGILLGVHLVTSILLIAALRPALDRAFTHGQRGLPIGLVVGGLLLPLGLVIVGGGPVWMVPAALMIILGSLAARFVLVRLPHHLA